MRSDEQAGGEPGTDGGGYDPRTDGGRRQTGSADGGTADGETGDRGGGTSLARNVGLVVLGLLLAVSLAGFSVVLAAQSTVLSADYVTETMADEEVYGDMEATVEEVMTDEASNTLSGTSAFPDAQEVTRNAIGDAVTPEYVETQARANIQRMYEYLHGRSDELTLSVDATRLLEEVPAAVATEIREMSLAEFVHQPAVGDGFASLGLDSDQLAATTEDPETFRETQTNVTRQLEATGQDSDDLNESVRADTDLGNVSAGVEESVYDIQGTVIHSLTSDTTHEEYVSQLETDQEAFAAAVGEFTRQQFESEVGSAIDLTEWLSPSDERTLEQNRQLVGNASLALYALPLVALVVLAVVLAVTHSIGRTSLVFGASLLTAGIGGLVASFLVGDRVLDTVRESVAGGEEFVGRTAIAIIDGLFGQLTLQSTVLVVLGLIFIAVFYAIGKLEPAQIPAEWQ